MTQETDKGECYCCETTLPMDELKDVARHFYGRFDDDQKYLACKICWTGWAVGADVYGRNAYGTPEVLKQMSVYTRMVLERLDDLEKKVDELLFRARFPGHQGPWSVHAYPGGDDEQ